MMKVEPFGRYVAVKMNVRKDILVRTGLRALGNMSKFKEVTLAPLRGKAMLETNHVPLREILLFIGFDPLYDLPDK